MGIGTDKWAGGVLANNGKIYGIPSMSEAVLIIDPTDDTADMTTMVGLSGDHKWEGGVLAGNGMIYGIPRDSTTVLIIDPIAETTDTASISGLTSDTDKWRGGVLASNGKIYGIPYNANALLIIDPVTQTADVTVSVSALDSQSTAKWGHGILAPDNKIYAFPEQAETMLMIDPATDSVHASSIPGSVSASPKWGQGAVLGADNRIYATPRSYDQLLILDPTNSAVNTSTLAGVTPSCCNEWNWGQPVVAGDGKIYALPREASTILIVKLQYDIGRVVARGSEFCRTGYDDLMPNTDPDTTGSGIAGTVTPTRRRLFSGSLDRQPTAADQLIEVGVSALPGGRIPIVAVTSALEMTAFQSTDKAVELFVRPTYRSANGASITRIHQSMAIGSGVWSACSGAGVPVNVTAANIIDCEQQCDGNATCIALQFNLSSLQCQLFAEHPQATSVEDSRVLCLVKNMQALWQAQGDEYMYHPPNTVTALPTHWSQAPSTVKHCGCKVGYYDRDGAPTCVEKCASVDVAAYQDDATSEAACVNETSGGFRCVYTNSTVGESCTRNPAADQTGHGAVGICPTTHPFPFDSGSKCCRTDYEAVDGGTDGAGDGGACDGSVLHDGGVESTCCATSSDNVAAVNCASPPCAAPACRVDTSAYALDSRGFSRPSSCPEEDCIFGYESVGLTGFTNMQSRNTWQCTACPTGKFGNMGVHPYAADADVGCQSCAQGFFGTKVAYDSSSDCIACTAGYYGEAAGYTNQSNCTACPGGRYSVSAARVSLSQCSQCSGGRYANGTGYSSSTDCMQCTANAYSPIESNQIRDCYCNAGYYDEDNTTTNDNVTCMACPAGFYSGVTHRTDIAQCIACVAGTYSATAARTSASQCISCPPGRYNTREGRDDLDDCTLCPTASTSPIRSDQLSDCACISGYYDADGYVTNQNVDCTGCPAGLYSGATARTSVDQCFACSAGRYSPLRAATSSTQCIACGTGRYSTQTGQDGLSAHGILSATSFIAHNFTDSPEVLQLTVDGVGHNISLESSIPDAQAVLTALNLSVVNITVVSASGGTYNGATFAPFDFHAASSGQYVGVVFSPYDFSVADAASSYAGVSFVPHDFSADTQDLVVAVDGGTPETITLSANCDTATNCAAAINIAGASVSATDGNMVITSNTAGPSSSVVVDASSGTNAKALFGSGISLSGTSATTEDLVVAVDGGTPETITLSANCDTATNCAAAINIAG
eukprot:SAG31_NODE_3191_length_4571_cov_2.395572_1_plen_1228_part_10